MVADVMRKIAWTHIPCLFDGCYQSRVRAICTVLNNSLASLLLVAALTNTTPAVAADIRPLVSGSGVFRAVVIEGNIEAGDFHTFVRIIKENQGKISSVFIFSPGGDFYEAMKIGRAIRQFELSSQVPMRNSQGLPVCEVFGTMPSPKDPKNCTCASAGFFIHIGGIHRGGTYLAVHRPYFGKGKFGELSQTDAQKAFDALQDSARAYMLEMGVPTHIQEEVLGTPSERALVFDDKTIKTYFWGELPYRHEWKRNRCSKLSEPEAQRAENYSRRRLRPTSAGDADLSTTEWEDFASIQKKRDEELQCALEVERQSRITAYERYFGTSPNDFSEHNFSKWRDATRYLGKQFYELLGEERFEEEKFSGSSYLTRSATANTPAISLSDSRYKPKAVARIGLVSTPNPSTEFTKLLVQSLEGAWGRQSGGNGITEWLWESKEFSAKLARDSASGKDSYLGLTIVAK